jgi:hypothetical protein
MDKELLKKSLLPGIGCGLMIALGAILVRMWVNGISYKDSLLSPFGIAALICFPIADVLAFYSDKKRKQGKEEKK